MTVMSFGNRIRETAEKTGAVYTLLGAITGRQSFVDGGQTGVGRFYCAAKGEDFEVGIGTVATGPDRLTVTSVLASSRGGTAVPFLGVLEIFNGVPAEYYDLIETTLAGKAALSHTHSAADLVSGIIPSIARIASGSFTGTEFVRGDRTLATPSFAIADVAPAALVGTFAHKWAADLGLGLSNNDPVTTWPDQAGSADMTSLAAGTDRPTYLADPDGDGIPCIRCDGSNDGLRVRALTAYTGADITVFMVVRVNTRNVSRHVLRLDDQSHTLSNPLCTMVLVDTQNALSVQARANSAAAYSAQPGSGNKLQGTDGTFVWAVFAFSWGTVGGNYVLRIWDTGMRTGSNPIASTALGYTRVSIGATPNDSTDAWVSSTFLAADYRFIGIVHSMLREDQIKTNLQYLSNRYKVGGVI